MHRSLKLKVALVQLCVAAGIVVLALAIGLSANLQVRAVRTANAEEVALSHMQSEVLSKSAAVESLLESKQLPQSLQGLENSHYQGLLSSLLETKPFGEEETLLVCDQAGNVLFSNSTSTSYQKSANIYDVLSAASLNEGITVAAIQENISATTGGSFSFESDKKQLAVYEPIVGSGSCLFEIVPSAVAAEELFDDSAQYANIVNTLIVVIALTAMIIIALLTYPIYRFFTKKQAEQQAKDELHRQLEQELHSAEEQLAKARVKNSTSQMQPHFLYNALASIREIIPENPQYASDLIVDFTTHLRACIRAMKSDDLVPFSKELENIKAYANIEMMRFGDDLQVNYEIEESDFDIAPLTIQPLVENAIRHGIFENGGGTVTVRSRKIDDKWVIEVEDNGCGFDKFKLQEEILSGQRDSTGLETLEYRLSNLQHGRVWFDSTPGVGTIVTVTLPIMTSQEHD